MKSGATTLLERSKRGLFLPIAVGGLPAAAGAPTHLGRMENQRPVQIDFWTGRFDFADSRFQVAKRSRGNIEKTRLRARAISGGGGDEFSASGSRILLSRTRSG